MTEPFQLPPDARHVLVAVNPNAGWRNNREIVEHLGDRLREAGLKVEACTDVGCLREVSTRLLENGDLRAVVAAGGDGTVSLIANHTPPGTPLLVVPLGTENLLAKHLGLMIDPDRLARIVTDGWVHRIDAGEAAGKLFTLMLGCGFDADVVRRLHSTRRGQIRHLSYAGPIFDAIRHYDYPELKVYYEPHDQPPGGESSLTGRWVFVVNIPKYAGGLNIAPGADGTDGLLDVCVFKEGSLWNGLYYLGNILLGQQQSLDGFACVRTRRVRIEADREAPYQFDGDPGGVLPVEANIRPGRLLMLVERTWAEKVMEPVFAVT